MNTLYLMPKKNFLLILSLVFLARLFSGIIIVNASVALGGDVKTAILVMILALVPGFILETLAIIVYGHLSHLFKKGDFLSDEVQKTVKTMSQLLYACFLFSGIGIGFAGWWLGMGFIIIAPFLAPLAPIACASAALHLLVKSIEIGDKAVKEGKDTI